MRFHCELRPFVVCRWRMRHGPAPIRELFSAFQCPERGKCCRISKFCVLASRLPKTGARGGAPCFSPSPNFAKLLLTRDGCEQQLCKIGGRGKASEVMDGMATKCCHSASLTYVPFAPFSSLFFPFLPCLLPFFLFVVCFFGPWFLSFLVLLLLFFFIPFLACDVRTYVCMYIRKSQFAQDRSTVRQQGSIASRAIKCVFCCWYLPRFFSCAHAYVPMLMRILSFTFPFSCSVICLRVSFSSSLSFLVYSIRCFLIRKLLFLFLVVLCYFSCVLLALCVLLGVASSFFCGGTKAHPKNTGSKRCVVLCLFRV